MKRFFTSFFSILLVCTLLSSVSGSAPASMEASAAAPPPGGEPRCLLISENPAVLSSEIAARIEAIHVDMGSEFKAGQTLVVLDTAIYKAQEQRAAVEVDAAEKSLAIHRELAEMKSVSELEMVAQQARLAAARAERRLHRIQVDLGTIRAPFDGRVVKRIVNAHEYVTPGQPLLEIIDNRLKLQLHVPSLWLRWLKPGIGFKVRVDETGRTYPARITQLGARVDPVSQTIEVRAEIQGRFPELLAGMSGTCRFTPPADEAH